MKRRSTGVSKSFTGIKDKKIRIYGIKKGGSGYSDKNAYYDVLGKSIWANYRSLSGYEYFWASNDWNITSVVFTINWHKEIRVDMIVIYNSKSYKIAYIDNLEGYKKELKLHCETLNSDIPHPILKQD